MEFISENGETSSPSVAGRRRWGRVWASVPFFLPQSDGGQRIHERAAVGKQWESSLRLLPSLHFQIHFCPHPSFSFARRLPLLLKPSPLINLSPAAPRLLCLSSYLAFLAPLFTSFFSSLPVSAPLPSLPPLSLLPAGLFSRLSSAAVAVLLIQPYSFKWPKFSLWRKPQTQADCIFLSPTVSSSSLSCAQTYTNMLLLLINGS